MEQQPKQTFEDSRMGLFTASEISRLLVSGSRPMTETELAEEKAKGGKRKTVDTLFGDGAVTYMNEKIGICITGETPPTFDTVATRWGKEQEEDAIKWFELITKKKVQHFGVFEYRFFPYKNSGGCSPDAKVIEESACVQVKCPYLSSNHVTYLRVIGDQKKRQEWLKKNEKDYYAQCQFEMMCLGEAEGKKTLEKCYFVTYDPRTNDHWLRMSIFELTPDESLQADIDLRITEAHKIVSETLKQFSEPSELYYSKQAA